MAFFDKIRQNTSCNVMEARLDYVGSISARYEEHGKLYQKIDRFT